MKALSLQNPWPWLIIHGYKKIENRSWNTSFRGQFLIHASKTWDAESFQNYKSMTEPFRRSRSLAACPFPPDMPEVPNLYPFGGIVGIADLVGVVTESDDPWFFGEYGFVLANARPLPFVPCNGALNFWEVPEYILKKLGIEEEEKILTPLYEGTNYRIALDETTGRYCGQVCGFTFDGLKYLEEALAWVASKLDERVGKQPILKKESEERSGELSVLIPNPK